MTLSLGLILALDAGHHRDDLYIFLNATMVTFVLKFNCQNWHLLGITLTTLTLFSDDTLTLTTLKLSWTFWKRYFCMNLKQPWHYSRTLHWLPWQYPWTVKREPCKLLKAVLRIRIQSYWVTRFRIREKTGSGSFIHKKTPIIIIFLLCKIV